MSLHSTVLDKTLHVDWHGMFVPQVSLLEIALRGTIIYLAVFAFLRVARGRHAGETGIADILVIVLIADAVSNGMASEYRSIPEGLVLAATIFFWSFALDWIAFHFPRTRWIFSSGPRCLIKDGEIQRATMRHELLSHDDLKSMLREQGVASPREVRRAYIEGDGAISILRYKDEEQPTRRKRMFR